MLTFADTPWQLLNAFLAFAIGLAIAITQARFFSVPIRSAVFLYIWHTAFCMFYFIYAGSNNTDSNRYYINSLNPNVDFNYGTAGIDYLTSFFSSGLGMSYGGTFLVFNIFGYIGMLVFAGCLRDTVALKSRTVKRLSLLIILTPGLSFWSASIGKDSISFMAAGLACWAAMNLSRRYPAMVIAIFAFLLVRPHMSGILMMSLSATMIFLWRANLAKKFILVVLTFTAAGFGASFGLDYAGLGDAANITDVELYFESRQNANMGGGSSINIRDMSVPMRLFSYLFRPLFLDASGLLAFIISLENLLVLALFLWFSAKVFITKSSLPVFPRWFMIMFTVISLLVLANTTANLGISLRQKWMFLPMLLLLIFSYIGKNRTFLLRQDK